MTETLVERRRPTDVASSAALPSHLRVTVLQAKDLKLKGLAQSGLHVVVKTFQTRHVTSKHVAPEWNEDFEFPLMGLDTIVKVSVKCKGTFGEEKLGCTYITLKDFNVLDRPVTKWYDLQSKSGSGKETKPRGLIQLTIGFVSRWKSTEALDLARDEPDCENLVFKRFAFGRFSLRKSLKRQSSQPELKRRRRDGSNEPSDVIPTSMPRGNNRQSANNRSAASSVSEQLVGSPPKDTSTRHFNKPAGSREAHRQMKTNGTHSYQHPLPDRPTRLFISGASSDPVQTTPIEETTGELQDFAAEGKVRVRLRRRRTVSGSLTPNTPVRASTFMYTNGISKYSLTNALHSSGEHEGHASTEGANKASPKVGTKERGSRESSEEKKSGGDVLTENRLQRFERRSFRLREYKRPVVGQMSPISLRSDRTTGMDSSKDVRLSSREASAVDGSDNYSSPEMSPSHSRSKSDEISNNESGGKLLPERNSLLLPSEASQRLMLSSSSSALTVSSSASSHSLQQPTYASTSAHATSTLPASEREASQAGPPLSTGVEEMKNTTHSNKTIDEMTADAKQVDLLPEGTGQLEDPDQSSSQFQSGSSTRASSESPQTQESLVGQEQTLKESGGDVFLPTRERKQNHPHVGNPPKGESDSSTPIPKEKDSKLRRRHTVQYPRDMAKYKKDFKMESVLPPSMMSAMSTSTTSNRASIVSETGEGTDQPSLGDIPPRPHSAFNFSGQITPLHRGPRSLQSSHQDVSSPVGRGTASFGPPCSTPTTKKEFSLPWRSNSDRRRNAETGMKRLLSLSAQAMRHRSSTLPRHLFISPTSDPLQSSSSAVSLKQPSRKGYKDGEIRKTISMPSRGNPSLEQTDGESSSRKNPLEMSREELIAELENSREMSIHLQQELDSLLQYNNHLLAKVMEHCPLILEMKM